MAKGGRRGVAWCIGYQSKGSFALEVECHIGAEHIYIIFVMSDSREQYLYSTIYVPLVLVH